MKGLDMVRWHAPPPGDHSPPSSCVSEWAAISVPTYPVNRCGTYLFFGGRSSAPPTPFSALSLPSPAARAMARLRQACSCPLATPGGSWRPAQGAKEAEAGPRPPLPLPRWRSWASGAPTLHLSACRTGGEEGVEQWAGHAGPGWARQASLSVGERVSRAVASWQAIRRAGRMGGSSPMAGEEWREGGARAPPWAN